jgi:two-component system nitrate/nitrite response regulator NarL
MSQKIRIILIDDHSLFRESLTRLLQSEPDIQVGGDFASIAEAVETLAKGADLLLLDYDLGEERGEALLQRVRDTGFGGRILLVTGGMSDAEIVRMLRCGISGVFRKHNPPAQLVDAIQRSMRGEIWLDSHAVQALVAEAASENSEARRQGPLTERERAVLAGLFEGLTNKEIAGKLRISENAVKWVLQQLFEKTGARVRSQLVRIVLERYGKDWLTPRIAGR